MDRACLGKFLLDRRTLLTTSAASLALSGSGPLRAASAAPFSDAHSHFFNAADLPIAGFAKYVLIPDWIGNTAAGAAIIDFLTYFIKPMAKTAEAELADLGAPATEEWTPLRFAAESARFVASRRSIAPVEDLRSMGVDQRQLASSYDALTASLMLDANYRPDDAPQLMELRIANGRPDITAHAFGEVARKAEGVGAWSAGDIANYNSPITVNSELLVPGLGSAAGAIARSMAWAYLMLKRRRSHLRDYVDHNGTSGRVVDLVINHLVDYDRWLDDTPERHSSHEAQIQFFSKLADEARTWTQPVQLRTFAGFCPLKLAMQTRKGGQRWFDQLKAHHAAGRIRGFKLYPPMGFQPLGNAGLVDGEFDTGGSSRTSALEQWRSVAPLTEPLGTALDGALTEFYTYCAANSVPIMAHARCSNGSANGYARRADPHIWRAVVDRHPLRLLLGHLISEAVTFDASPANAPADASWTLDATVQMLTNPNFTSGAQVYGDLAYMPELVRNPTLARDFFIRLKQVFGDVGLKRICYGTDWIMFAREPHNREYLGDVIDGMTAANYSHEQKADILENNVRRFLGS